MIPVVETNSETWKAVERFIKENLYLRRKILECAGVDLADTENARGAIEILLALRDEADPDLAEPLNPEVGEEE